MSPPLGSRAPLPPPGVSEEVAFLSWAVRTCLEQTAVRETDSTLGSSPEGLGTICSPVSGEGKVSSTDLVLGPKPQLKAVV